MTIYGLRKSLGLRQGDFARKIGCSQSSLCRWEYGEFRPSRKFWTVLQGMGVDGVSEDTERSDRDRANAQLLDEYEGTGITHAALAEKHGVHVNTIRNRLNRSRMERDRRDARERMRR